MQGAINETNCSMDVGSCNSFRSKFFARRVSCFKSFSLIEYAFANFFKCSSDRNVRPRGQRAEMPERITPEPLQNVITKFCEVAGGSDYFVNHFRFRFHTFCFRFQQSLDSIRAWTLTEPGLYLIYEFADKHDYQNQQLTIYKGTLLVKMIA